MDINIEEHTDAFSVRRLWRPSRFTLPDLQPDATLFPELELDVNAIKIDNPYAPTKSLEHDLRLPDLDTFQYGPLDDLDSVQESTESAAPAQHLPQPEAPDDQIWEDAAALAPARDDVRFHTWEAFEKPDFQEPMHAYIAEAGPEAFDAALLRMQEADPSKEAGRIVRSDILLGSLFNLGLGRSSVLFRYEQTQHAFAQAIHDQRMSGFSLVSAQNLIRDFLRGGSAFKSLREFADRTRGAQNTFPSKVALATAIETILSTMENHLGSQRNAVSSLLQLEQLFRRSHQILLKVQAVTDEVKPLSTNEDLITLLYTHVHDMEQDDTWLRSVFLDILKSVSNPWLEFAAEWAGLRRGFKTGFTKGDVKHTFVGVEETSEDQNEPRPPPEHFYRSENMPTFIPDEDGRTLFETGKSLRFLEVHHPSHPLCAPHKVGLHAPPLDWKFGWEDMESIAAKAKNYERSLAEAIRKYKPTSTDHEQFARRSSDDGTDTRPVMEPANYEREILDTIDVFDQDPAHEESASATTLHSLVLSSISPQSHPDKGVYTFAPPIALTPTLSLTPLFRAQARLVNATTLRLFFRSHNLRLHLSLQRQYQLLGDGMFMYRLTSALLSPELETAERRRGTVRTGAPMGIKLGSRSTWPPASSELRLALMGILSESYHSSRLYRSAKNHASYKKQEKRLRETPDLPGNLSFSIRVLSNDEIEKCMDPNSLYALDFLRLQYTPPPPLNLVMTASALDKYDSCFRLLLRIVRMLFVVNHQLPREGGVAGVWESRCFRNEAHHFVSAVSAYFFDSGIGETWQAFEAGLDGLERRMRTEDECGDGDDEVGGTDGDSSFGRLVVEGLESVRAAHEECLDRVMFALLLRRRQQQVMRLLEEIFETILAFAKRASGSSSSNGGAYSSGGAAGAAASGPAGGRQGGGGQQLTAVAVSAEEAREVREMHMLFRSKVNVFMTVCRGLTGKRGSRRAAAAGRGAGVGLLLGGDGRDVVVEEENTIDRLLLKLEMNGYYGAPVTTDLGS
ncbi:gamma-tubulin complex component gcp6 [Diplodia corticola]|uniref:Spindle pole body component n=1 Tax=Diplodia corticola TaxID=236234 RepID=A0A1J9S445_9PEZI|nr:gamma-tubulin complex component gcp6 [Diplodia corticola]OJD34405.1 gamma-tubulin complex component gcp6 [Diplodia corticola]